MLLHIAMEFLESDVGKIAAVFAVFVVTLVLSELLQ